MNSAIKTLPRANAFSPGADVWITASENDSQWTNQIDWLIDLQILNAKRKDNFKINENVEKIRKQYDCDEVNIEVTENAPLLVSTKQHLPNRYLLILPEAQKQKDWVLNCFKAWIQLDRPGLRVFLPSLLDINEFKRHWPEKHSSTRSISLIPGTL